MAWRSRFSRKTKGPSEESLAEVLNRLDDFHERRSSRRHEASFKETVQAVKKAMTSPKGRKQGAVEALEVEIDTDMLDKLVGIIQETMHDQHDVTDERWPKRLQWPSQKYLRASWICTWEQLQPETLYYVPGEAKISSANAGHLACLGPCLLQAPTPVHTVIVHGELEYCTLLGHRLHIDLAVYFAALRTLAHFLSGNTHLRELVFAFTGCPKVVTDKSQEPVSECLASQVLPAFEKVLADNETLRYVSFRVSHKPTRHVNLRRMCATSFETNCRRRTAVLCGLQPRSPNTLPLVRGIPRDVLKRILDTAFPLPGPSGVDFEYCHLSSSWNRSRFAFLKLDRWQGAAHGCNRGSPCLCPAAHDDARG